MTGVGGRPAGSCWDAAAGPGSDPAVVSVAGNGPAAVRAIPAGGPRGLPASPGAGTPPLSSAHVLRSIHVSPVTFFLSARSLSGSRGGLWDFVSA